MAVSQIGAFYATGSSLLQRIYVPHADDSEIDEQPIGDGESLMLVPVEVYQDGGAQAVQAAIGASSHSGRCAVVNFNTNVVEDIILADPEVYSDPDGNLVIQSDDARHGDVWDGENFLRVEPH